MSLPSVNIKLTVKSGGVLGAPRIKGTLNAVKTQTNLAFQNLLAQQAIKRMPQRTGAMMGSFMANIYGSSLFNGGMEIGSDVPYAGYVNAFVPPINWTKSGSWYHWHDKMIRFAFNNLTRILKEKIRAWGLNTATGSSIAGVAREFEVTA